jgi:hypothetical protein
VSKSLWTYDEDGNLVMTTDLPLDDVEDDYTLDDLHDNDNSSYRHTVY